MFDIGFWELAMILVVALVVIGPERLPSAAATAGKWIGRMRRFISNVKDDIDREIRQEELKKALENNAGLDEIKDIMNKPILDTERYVMHDEDDDEEPAKPGYQVKAIPDEPPTADHSPVEEKPDEVDQGNDKPESK